MSIFTAIKDSIIKGYLLKFFSKDNLTQPSTWKGVIRIAIATGVINLSGEVQDTLIQLIIQIIATGTMATGVIDAIRNENKKLPWKN